MAGVSTAGRVLSADNMHDASFSLPSATKAADEVETCRICRGEGTKDETLFYPCKCSGSIKFVHQDCLMEWLSHSQKKYCELCKTPFRFTKLYDPSMPPTIPATVFIRKAALHILTNILLWCRAFLVAFIWIFLLPLSMRWAWRSLFWVADGGWARHEYTSKEMKWRGPGFEVGVAVPLPRSNLTASQSTQQSQRFSFMPNLFSALTSQPQADVTPINQTSIYQPPSHGQSLLSGLAFFKTLTPSSVANRFITDILEGQIITICVVIAFILLFLIREWVIQQQPVIHMAAMEDEQQVLAATNVDQEEPIQPPELDPSITAEQAVDSLLEDFEALRTFGDRADHSDSGESARTTPAPDEPRRNARRMVRIHQVMGAMQKATKAAFRSRDPERLENLILSLDRLKSVLQYLHEEDVAEVEQSIQALRRTISVALLSLRETLPTPQLRSQSAGPSGSSQPADHAHDASVDQGESSADAESRMRPAMPRRPESSLATEIRRNLEENTGRAAVPVENNTRIHNDDNTSSSTETPESWEDVFDSDLRAELQSSDAQAEGPMELAPSLDTLLQNEASETPQVVAGTSNTSRAEDSTDIAPAGENSVAHTETPQVVGESSPGDSTAQDTTAAQEPPNVEAAEARPESVIDRILNWIWGEDVAIAENVPNANQDEQVVIDFDDLLQRDVAPNPPLEPGEQAAENMVQDADVAAAVDAHADNNRDDPGIDPDAEDLEGIMELIGMQGPLMGLFQNAVFSAVLIFITLSSCIWLPYLWGKVIILFAAHPIQLLIKMPAQTVSIVANMAVDFAIFFGAMLIHWLDSAIRFSLLCLSRFGHRFAEFSGPNVVSKGAAKAADDALLRIVSIFIAAGDSVGSDYFHLSLNAHIALRKLQGDVQYVIDSTSTLLLDLYHRSTDQTVNESSSTAMHIIYAAILPVLQKAYLLCCNIGSAIMSTFRSAAPSISSAAGSAQTIAAVEDLVYWDAMDRLIVILAGYGFFTLIGAFYLKKRTPAPDAPRRGHIETAFIDFLQQAGGVLKVILIISIEMIVFPLYCGFLLDVAMLPLFEHVNIMSRVNFTLESPWTSVFVHWFIGTCYMFHFALFVSMCRRILRTGVLYFIRDPDDPTFHPIRDVLERSVSSQLRKIGFSGLVYGGLVIVCLGSVVWTLNSTVMGLLPIHWTSGEPVLRFPIDLLMYNFLMPLIFKTNLPSQGVTAMYTWWFKTCAHALRLTHFLFGEQRPEEEKGRPGKFVRAPASDQVRIPKDRDVFLEVDRENRRLDGRIELENYHGKNDPHYTKVFIPPMFMCRIALFVLCLWALTAVAGMVVTVLPLLVGRRVAALLIRKPGPVNDIHAFALGIYMFGGAAHLVMRHWALLKRTAHALRNRIAIPSPGNRPQLASGAWHTIKRFSIDAACILYTYSAFIILFPTLFALILQFYAIMPLHTYLRTAGYTFSIPLTHLFTKHFPPTSSSPSHHIHFLQDWTLGVLYLRIALRVILGQPDSRHARALRGVVANGWLRPNARLATRCFIIPALFLSAGALLGPAALGWLAGCVLTTGPLSTPSRLDPDAAAALRVLAYRFAYPAVLATALAGFTCARLAKATAKWRLRIRDEVYLIGERLHNFGEKRPVRWSGPSSASAASATPAQVATVSSASTSAAANEAAFASAAAAAAATTVEADASGADTAHTDVRV